MRHRLLTAVAGVCVLAAVVSAGEKPTSAPATRPAAVFVDDVSLPLELRISKLMDARQYETALPLLRRLERREGGDARKLKAIKEQIAIAERGANAPGGTAADDRKPHMPPTAGQVLEFANIKDLGNFEYDAVHGGGLPADVVALNGATIRLHGFMIPLDQAENISSFALVPSLFACCFGQPPGIQHTVMVTLPKGKAVSYFPDEIVIEGTLGVEEKREDGYVVSVFQMTATSVKAAGR